MMISKLIKQVGLFATIWIVLIVFICQALPFHYFNGEYPMWKSKMELLENNKGFNNLILGDSRVIAGIDPKVLGSNYYNLALGGGTPMEGYYMLKKLLENQQKVDTILVSYAPLHFEQSEMFWDRQLKYRFYDQDEIKEIFNQLNQNNERFWQYDDSGHFSEKEKDEYLKKAYVNYFRSPFELRTELSKSFLLRGYSNRKVYKEIKKRRGAFDFGHAAESNDLNVEAQREQFKPQSVMIESLRNLFDLALKNNIKVVYMTLPMNEASLKSLSKQYSQNLVLFNKSLQKSYPNILFVNDPLLYYNNTYFGDASHLNKVGRERFSIALKNLFNESTLMQKKDITAVQFEDLQ